MPEWTLAEALDRLLFGALAMLHLLPVAAIRGGRQLRALYGVGAETPALAVLLRHRALQFGLLAALAVAAVFDARWRVPAALALAASMLGFVLIARCEHGGNAQLRRVAWIDLGALASLALWALARLAR